MEIEKNSIVTDDMINRFSTRYGIDKYITNLDMSITIYGTWKGGEVKDESGVVVRKVVGNFSIRNQNLTKLPQCPDVVEWNVLININSITSLKGLSKHIVGNLYMMHNKLVIGSENFDILYNTYVGGEIEGDKSFMDAYNRYKTIRNIID
jgi:hypothetical protein